MSKIVGFGECTNCNKWGDIPQEFNETKDFLKCPNCGSPMYLVRGLTAAEVGFRESNKVTITEFIKHKG